MAAHENISGKQFRKVGPYRMIRHRTGHWESEDGFHFIQGTPPTKFWDVQKDPDVYDPVYESDASSLVNAVYQFRKYQEETK